MRCSECEQLTTETCPECRKTPLCGHCQTEYGMCSDCGEDPEEEDDVEEDD